jgi:hypothetical protein
MRTVEKSLTLKILRMPLAFAATTYTERPFGATAFQNTAAVRRVLSTEAAQQLPSPQRICL